MIHDEALAMIESRLKHILLAGDARDSVSAARVLVELYKLRAYERGLERPPPSTPEEVVEAVREMMREAGYEIVEIERH
jgi:hypothetical protein